MINVNHKYAIDTKMKISQQHVQSVASYLKFPIEVSNMNSKFKDKNGEYFEIDFKYVTYDTFLYVQRYTIIDNTQDYSKARSNLQNEQLFFDNLQIFTALYKYIIFLYVDSIIANDNNIMFMKRLKAMLDNILIIKNLGVYLEPKSLYLNTVLALIYFFFVGFKMIAFAFEPDNTYLVSTFKDEFLIVRRPPGIVNRFLRFDYKFKYYDIGFWIKVQGANPNYITPLVQVYGHLSSDITRGGYIITHRWLKNMKWQDMSLVTEFNASTLLNLPHISGKKINKNDWLFKIFRDHYFFLCKLNPSQKELNADAEKLDLQNLYIDTKDDTSHESPILDTKMKISQKHVQSVASYLGFDMNVSEMKSDFKKGQYFEIDHACVTYDTFFNFYYMEEISYAKSILQDKRIINNDTDMFYTAFLYIVPLYADSITKSNSHIVFRDILVESLKNEIKLHKAIQSNSWYLNTALAVIYFFFVGFRMIALAADFQRSPYIEKIFQNKIFHLDPIFFGSTSHRSIKYRDFNLSYLAYQNNKSLAEVYTHLSSDVKLDGNRITYEWLMDMKWKDMSLETKFNASTLLNLATKSGKTVNKNDWLFKIFRDHYFFLCKLNPSQKELNADAEKLDLQDVYINTKNDTLHESPILNPLQQKHALELNKLNVNFSFHNDANTNIPLMQDITESEIFNDKLPTDHIPKVRNSMNKSITEDSEGVGYTVIIIFFIMFAVVFLSPMLFSLPALA